MRTLSIGVRNWCAPWAYASVPYAHAQHAHQFSYFSNVHFVHPQHAHLELMRQAGTKTKSGETIGRSQTLSSWLGGRMGKDDRNQNILALLAHTIMTTTVARGWNRSVKMKMSFSIFANSQFLDYDVSFYHKIHFFYFWVWRRIEFYLYYIILSWDVIIFSEPAMVTICVLSFFLVSIGCYLIFYVVI
jgi:hypothetical protein